MGKYFKELSEVSINVTIKLGKIGCKFLVGELEMDFARSNCYKSLLGDLPELTVRGLKLT